MIRVAIMDDHYVVRVGLKTIIDMDPELEFVGEASSGEGADVFIAKTKPDVLLLDIRMPGKDGIETLSGILAANPSQKVVMLTTSDADDEVYRALKKGALGYLMKDRDSDSICMAVKTVAAGSRFIPDAVKEIYRRRQMMDEPTPREREVLELVAAGHSNDKIAKLLGIAYESVKVHVKHLLFKFDVKDRTELVSTAIRGGFVKTLLFAVFSLPAFAVGASDGQSSNVDAGAQPISLQGRIDAASAAGGGVVTIPAGECLTDGPIHLKSNVELHLEDGATLVFPDDPEKYLPTVPTSWEGVECLNYSPLIYAYGCTNVAITGKGTVAPRMGAWRKWFARGKGHNEATRRLYDWCSFNAPLEERDLTKIPDSKVRPHLIHLNRCRDIRLEGFKIRESPFWTIHLFLCDGAVVRGLDVYAHGHNNDGIDIEMTKNVLVENCRFDQGDDAVVIKSGRNQDAWRLATPSENIEVRNCTIVNGHVLLGIGSELSGGVRNVYMHDCRLENSALRLFYVKTNERRGGFVEDIRMENITAKKVRYGMMAVETDVFYQWKDFPTHEVRVTPIRRLSMKNVAVEEAERMIDIRGDSRAPVEGVTLDGIRVGKVAKPDRVENAIGVRAAE